MPILSLFWLFPCVFLISCTTISNRDKEAKKLIESEMASFIVESAPISNDTVSESLYPSPKLDLPETTYQVLEPRFDISVNDAPARQVLMGIVVDTRYSMLLPNELEGNVTINLKNVTVPEALSALKKLYGYEYQIDGSQIFIQPQKLQTRIMKINYPNTVRKGESDIRVVSGTLRDQNTNSSGSKGGVNTNLKEQIDYSNFVTSKVSTTLYSDFWGGLLDVIKTIIGDKDGRSVTVSPQSGVLVVRAFPSEINEVEAFLKASQISLERQVMIEAKIIEVILNSSYQAGINWAVFGAGHFSAGQLSPDSEITRDSKIKTSPISGIASSSLSNAPGSVGTMFGMVLKTGNFDAVLNLLDSQGRVEVLSNPRISTLNNQKAILKVGSDDFYVTGVSANPVSSTTNGPVYSDFSPVINMQPFFSGISLDVTPQIDESDHIILHIHPMISDVQSKMKNIKLGKWGSIDLPMASSKVSEIDSVIKAQSGQLVVLGGLIRQHTSKNHFQLPGLSSLPIVGQFFKQRDDESERRELVILLKPTVIQSSADWSDDIIQSQARIKQMIDSPNSIVNKKKLPVSQEKLRGKVAPKSK